MSTAPLRDATRTTTMATRTRNVEDDPTDFSDEKNMMRFVRKDRWLSVDIAGYRVLRCNWVTSLLASVITWGFIAWSLIDETRATTTLGDW